MISSLLAVLIDKPDADTEVHLSHLAGLAFYAAE